MAFFSFLGKKDAVTIPILKEKTLNEKIEDVSFDGLIRRRIAGKAKDVTPVTYLEKKYITAQDAKKDNKTLPPEDTLTDTEERRIEIIKDTYHDIGKKSEDLKNFFRENLDTNKNLTDMEYVDIQWQLENACLDFDGDGTNKVTQILEDLGRWQNLKNVITEKEKVLHIKNAQDKVKPQGIFRRGFEGIKSIFSKGFSENENARDYIQGVKNGRTPEDPKIGLLRFKEKIIQLAQSTSKELKRSLIKPIYIPRGMLDSLSNEDAREAERKIEQELGPKIIQAPERAHQSRFRYDKTGINHNAESKLPQTRFKK